MLGWICGFYIEFRIERTMPHDLDTLMKWVSIGYQVIIVFIFIGSFTVGLGNLRAFQRSNNMIILKNVLDDYRKLVDNNAFEAYLDELATWEEDMAASHLTAHSYYYNRLRNIAAIGIFYEHLAVLVNKKIVKFELLFEIMPFPDRFWNDTREFQEKMGAISYADFWKNFEQLHDLYAVEREQRANPRTKKQVLNLKKKTV